MTEIIKHLRAGSFWSAAFYKLKLIVGLEQGAGAHWVRIVMNRRLEELVTRLPHSKWDAAEISGTAWQKFKFRSYQTLDFPDFDLCATQQARDSYDLIIAEQVFEHVRYPYRAAKSVLQLLRPGGYFLISVPFLIRVHLCPEDNCRWTASGLKNFLDEAGFDVSAGEFGQWGNKKCLLANLKRWENFNPKKHSLENDQTFPLVAWAIVRKPG